MTWIVYLLVIWRFFEIYSCCWAEMYMGWYGFIWAEIWPGDKLSHYLPHKQHVATKSVTRGWHVSDMWMPRQQHVDTTSMTRHRHVVATVASRGRHVSASSSATSTATSSLKVTWRVNPWRSRSSQNLGFGLGSMGFTLIYDGLKTSWITSIHDENVNTSQEVICDAQSMTKWNFVIDAILWRKLDDPWRKSTVIDHKVFCSVCGHDSTHVGIHTMDEKTSRKNWAQRPYGYTCGYTHDGWEKVRF
jgi:hypothetical protein